MKLKSSILLFSILALSNATAHQVCTKTYGKTLCFKGKINDINGNGTVILNNTVVMDQTRCNGLFIANQAQLNLVNINGSAKEIGTITQGKTTIKGSLNANHSFYQSDLILYSSLSTFNESTLHNLVVNKTSANSETIVLNNSNIKGDVTFKSGLGKIMLKGNSTVSGHISGGEIIQA